MTLHLTLILHTITMVRLPLPFDAGACSERAHPRGVGGDDAEQQLPNLGRGRVFGGDESGDNRRRIQASGVRARQSPGLPHGTARKLGEKMEEAVVAVRVYCRSCVSSAVTMYSSCILCVRCL